MQPTQQQYAIIDAARTGHSVAVNAGPGCGKSTMLRLVSQTKHGPMVNFCFNKSTKLAADRTMPSHCKNFTFHGVAFKALGYRYARKLDIKLSPLAIAAEFNCDDHVATVAKYTLRRYAISEDGIILNHHVPREAVMAKPANERFGFQEEVVRIARKTWLAAFDRKNTTIGIEHDFYLKAAIEEGNVLPGQRELVLVDEGQDMVPINVKLLRQLGGQQIVVGDKNQNLYGSWRGTVDLLDQLPHFVQRDLTVSHRFGPAIAEVANRVLALFPGHNPPLIGAASDPGQVIPGKPSGRHAVLCRTNAGLLTEVLAAIEAGHSIHVVGPPGTLSGAILLLESAWYLSIGQKDKVRHPAMKLVNDWETVVLLAKEDGDFGQAVKRVAEYGSEIPRLCEQLRSASEVSIHDAELIVSTVHKAKGAEFDTVRLAEDFPDLIGYRKKDDVFFPKVAEIAVFFVAVTRAKRVLHPNTTVAQLKIWKELLE